MATSSLVADPGSVEEIAGAVESRRIDPVGLLERSLQRIEAVEPQVQGWCLLDRDGALRQAEVLRHEAEAGRIRSPLHGVPVAVKDVLDVAGLPTRAGSATRANAPASTIDAHVVTLLRTAGAIILGKAHTTEFAYFEARPPRAIRTNSPIRPAARAPVRRLWSPQAWCRKPRNRPPVR